MIFRSLSFFRSKFAVTRVFHFHGKYLILLILAKCLLKKSFIEPFSDRRLLPLNSLIFCMIWLLVQTVLTNQKNFIFFLIKYPPFNFLPAGRPPYIPSFPLSKLLSCSYLPNDTESPIFAERIIL